MWSEMSARFPEGGRNLKVELVSRLLDGGGRLVGWTCSLSEWVELGLVGVRLLWESRLLYSRD